MIRLKASLGALAVALTVGAGPIHAQAAGSFVTGTEWTASGESEKLSYLMGVANLMSADYELQRQGGQARGSAITTLYRATQSISPRQAMGLIDAWYASNPTRMNEDVLSVIWLTLVER